MSAAERDYELLLADGRRAVWSGRDPEDASRRYVDAHRQATVVAWRHWPRFGLFVGSLPIVEPGDERQRRRRS